MLALHAPVASVTVYTGNARVTRRGLAHVQAGEHTLVIDGLPASIDEQSVRAAGRGEHVRLLGVDVATQYVTEAPEANLAELRARLDTLQDELKALGNADAQLDDRAQFLRGLRDHASADLSKTLAWGRTTIDHVGVLADYLARQLGEIYEQKHTNAQRRRSIEREIEALKARLEHEQPSRPLERRQICVSLEASAETDVELEVMYAVSGASWTPVYDLRLEDGGKVALTCLAQVKQQTGEDWRAAQLSLSTARPAATKTIPELSPWYVDFVRPVAAPQLMERVMDIDARTPAFGMAAPPPQAAVLMAEVDAGGAAVTYHIARPADIPADGTAHKVTIAALDLHARLDYVIAPKPAQEAYLRATIQNDTPYMLLAGMASIYHGHDYVGAARLDAVAPGETFETQLGVDDRVKVERILTERAAARSPILIGNQRRTTWAYKISVTNLRAEAIRARVLDQIPVARNEDIKVKLLEATPKPAQQSDLGELAWELELQPGAGQDLTFSFVVEHSRDRSLVGIN